MNIKEKVEKKKSKGKHKIAIEAIKNKTQMQVTFSKRRGGLFKKASELCILCGVNIAIFTFSPAAKLFSFGHPTAEAVIQRYINNAINCNNNRNSNIDKYLCKGVEEYMDTIRQIEAEKKASTSSNNNSNNNGRDYYNGGFWWDNNIDNLGLVELQHFKIALEGLRDEVATRVNEINRLLSMSLVPHQNIEFGSRDGKTVAHCKNIDGSNYNTSCWNNDQSLMSVVSQNIDVVGTRDGNNVAHTKKIDRDDQSLMSVVVGTRDNGNNVAHYHQGFDETS